MNSALGGWRTPTRSSVKWSRRPGWWPNWNPCSAVLARWSAWDRRFSTGPSCPSPPPTGTLPEIASARRWRSTGVLGIAAADVSCLAHLGWIDRLQGRSEQALRYGRQALQSRNRPPTNGGGPFAIGMLAGTLSEHGEGVRGDETADGRSVDDWPGHPKVFELRILAPLAELTGSSATLQKADAMLAGISAPAGSAWLLGTDFYLSVARAWLDHDEPRRAHAVLEPLLVAAERQHWLPALAGGLLVDGRALAALGLTRPPPRGSTELWRWRSGMGCRQLRIRPRNFLPLAFVSQTFRCNGPAMPSPMLCMDWVEPAEWSP